MKKIFAAYSFREKKKWIDHQSQERNEINF